MLKSQWKIWYLKRNCEGHINYLTSQPLREGKSV